MVIVDVQIFDAQAGRSPVEVNLEGVVFDLYHPEHVVRVDVHVVIVNLMTEIESGRSGRIGIQVQSNKGERALVLSTVHADEPAFTKAHVRSEPQNRRFARNGVRSGAAAVNIRQAYEPVEVSNL